MEHNFKDLSYCETIDYKLTQVKTLSFESCYKNKYFKNDEVV